MGKLVGRIFEAVRVWFEQLKDRERKFVLLLGGVLVLGCFGAVALWTNATIGEKARRIESAEKQLEEMTALESQYRRAKAKQESEERKFRGNSVGLFSFLQTTSTRLGLTLTDLSEQKTPVPDSNLVETSVAINLRQLSMDKLTAFLEAIEETNPGSVVKITKLRVRTRFDARDQLDVQMTVSTWKSQS